MSGAFAIAVVHNKAAANGRRFLFTCAFSKQRVGFDYLVDKTELLDLLAEHRRTWIVLTEVGKLDPFTSLHAAALGMQVDQLILEESVIVNTFINIIVFDTEVRAVRCGRLDMVDKETAVGNRDTRVTALQ